MPDVAEPAFLPPIRASRRAGRWLFGFPIRTSLLDEILRDIERPPSGLGLEGAARVRDEWHKWTDRFENISYEICPGMRPAVRMALVRANLIEESNTILFSLVDTRHSTNLAPPPPEQLERLKEVLFENGFKDEPGWFPAED